MSVWIPKLGQSEENQHDLSENEIFEKIHRHAKKCIRGRVTLEDPVLTSREITSKFYHSST